MIVSVWASAKWAPLTPSVKSLHSRSSHSWRRSKQEELLQEKLLTYYWKDGVWGRTLQNERWRYRGTNRLVFSFFLFHDWWGTLRWKLTKKILNRDYISCSLLPFIWILRMLYVDFRPNGSERRQTTPVSKTHGKTAEKKKLEKLESKDLSPAPSVERVFYINQTLTDTWEFTQERSLILALSVERVSVIKII